MSPRASRCARSLAKAARSERDTRCGLAPSPGRCRRKDSEKARTARRVACKTRGVCTVSMRSAAQALAVSFSQPWLIGLKRSNPGMWPNTR